MKITVLGPEETLSHCIAKKLFPEAEIFCISSFDALFEALTLGKADYIIAPLHNTLSGYVQETLFHLLRDPVCIAREIEKKIVFHLVGKGGIETADYLFAHPITYKQCIDKINRLCPHCEIIYTDSNSDAIKQVNECHGSALALAIDGHGLDLFEENMQTENNNTTRFLLIGRQASIEGDKTALMISDILDEVPEKEVRAIFSRNAVKVIEFESLFLDDKMVYWITCSGHFNDALFQDLLESLTECGRVKVLGSYV